jgi:hypothetical protein
MCAARGDGQCKGFRGIAGQLLHDAVIERHLPQVHDAAAIADEHEGLAIRGEVRERIERCVVGQATHIAPVGDPQIAKRRERRNGTVARSTGAEDPGCTMRAWGVEGRHRWRYGVRGHPDRGKQVQRCPRDSADAAAPDLPVGRINDLTRRSPRGASDEYILSQSEGFHHGLVRQHEHPERARTRFIDLIDRDDAAAGPPARRGELMLALEHFGSAVLSVIQAQRADSTIDVHVRKLAGIGDRRKAAMTAIGYEWPQSSIAEIELPEGEPSRRVGGKKH